MKTTIVEAAKAMHQKRRRLAQANGGPIEFDVEWEKLPKDLKEIDYALAEAALQTAQHSAVSCELSRAVSKLALKMGEEWRVGEGAEIMDALQAHDEDMLDARRWRALVTCGRIRFHGTAGYGDAAKGRPADFTGYRHFGAEFWNMHPVPSDSAYNAREVLEGFADALIHARHSLCPGDSVLRSASKLFRVPLDKVRKEQTDTVRNMLGEHDAHCHEAAEIFQVPVDKVTPEQRRYARTATHGDRYGVATKNTVLNND